LPVQSVKQTPAAHAGSQPPTAESLGWQLRAALPPLKLHSVSLYDPAGEILWLSEGALGPDEQAFVLEALGALSAERSTGHCERDFGDGRGAVFLAVRSPQAELVGLVMILVDAKALASGALASRVLSAPVRALLQKVAILLRPSAGGETSAASSSATGIRSLEILEWRAPESAVAPTAHEASGTHASPLAAGESAAGVRARAADETLPPRAVDEMLTIELSESQPAPPRGGDAVGARAPGELHVRELAKLRPGGRMRRFRVLPKPPLTSEQSLLAPVRELGAWLTARPEARDGASFHFSLAVSESALADDGLLLSLVESVGSSGIDPGCLGFELPESAYVRDRERAERFVQAIERLGCFLVVDDFTFDTGALELLRSRALRLLKIDGALTRAAMRDKLAQARVVAISQAARVLGVHCAAKQIETAASHRWLAAAGFDFAEGPLFGAPRPLASLADELADRK